jgi:hypothetical protein
MFSLLLTETELDSELGVKLGVEPGVKPGSVFLGRCIRDHPEAFVPAVVLLVILQFDSQASSSYGYCSPYLCFRNAIFSSARFRSAVLIASKLSRYHLANSWTFVSGSVIHSFTSIFLRS